MINFVNIGSVIADILVICIFILSIFQAYRRGLTSMIFNLVCLLITVIAVLILSKPITNLIYEHTNIDEFFSNHIENAIGEFIEEQIEKNGKIDTSKTNLSESIVNTINGYIQEAEEKSVTHVSKFVADKLSYFIISAIVLVVLFIVVRISTLFLKVLLYFLSHLPIIKNFDKFGGIAYGIFRAYIIIYFVLAILSLLSPLFSNIGLNAYIKASHICSKFYNNNIFLKIFS